MKGKRKQLDDIVSLIPKIYEAAVDEGCWKTLAASIAQAFNSSSTTLQILDHGQTHILDMTENVRASIDDYWAHYNKHDIWIERGIARVGLGNVGASKDMLTDAEFKKTEFDQDWCRKMDVYLVWGHLRQRCGLSDRTDYGGNGSPAGSGYSGGTLYRIRLR